MKKSDYDIDGNRYTFNNARLKEIIRSQNPNRGAYEQFYRRVVNQNVGISYDTVKAWVKTDTNPAIEDVKKIAEILEVPYMLLLECTHYSVETVRSRLQTVSFEEILDPFSLKYRGFSNVLDLIIGMGYNSATKECKDADFAERIISIIGMDRIEECGLPELLGYKFTYTDDELKNMTGDEFANAINNGYVDDEGNSFYDKDHKITIDRKKFGERLIENTSWLDVEDCRDLQEVIEEARAWWDYCEMPFAVLKIDINVCGHHLESFTYGPGLVKPTHEDRWTLIMDILSILGSQVDTTGLCWIKKMRIDQFESELFFTVEVCKHFS